MWSLSRGRAMKRTDIYVDLDGQEISLVHLDAEERKLLARILRRARTNPDWDAFDNWWTLAIPAFYLARGLSRKSWSGGTTRLNGCRGSRRRGLNPSFSATAGK